jgi:glycosyltransferase involved in cell wall biosynthesis
MKVAVIHNRYRQPGGEDHVYEAESALLESRGHEVVRYCDHNDRITTAGTVTTALATTWNPASYRALRNLFRRERPQVAHFHNTFPLISPSGYWAARAEGVPVVQTLHNYRLLCPMAQLMRDGKVCEACVGRSVAWPGVVHACYRGSRGATAAVAMMLGVHGAIGTWRRMVDVWVALTDFARTKYVQAGVPEGRIVVKANFVDDPGAGVGTGNGPVYALFVGRLSREKGIEALIAAWEKLGTKSPALWIVGDGPMAPVVSDAAARSPNIRWLGHQPRDGIFSLMKRALFLVFPSLWYEGLPLVVVESYATGLPVVASDLGAMRSLVEQGVTGFRVPPGDSGALAERAEWFVTHPEDVARMRDRARETYVERFTPERSYDGLMSVYRKAMAIDEPNTDPAARTVGVAP